MGSSDESTARLVAFGQRVRTLRRQAGLSQEQLAHLAAMHRTEVGFIERAEREFGLLAIWELAAALGVPPEDLVRGID